MSVIAPIVVPLIETLAPVIGPWLSFTTPEILLFCKMLSIEFRPVDVSASFALVCTGRQQAQVSNESMSIRFA